MHNKEDVEAAESDETIKDNDCLYVCEEDNDNSTEKLDTSSYNFSQMPEDPDFQSEENSLYDKQSRTPVMRLLLTILSNPVEGWKKVRREKVSVESAQANCFYPLLALMALSKFASLLYTSRVTVSELLIEAMTSFVGYFAGYFLIVILLKLLMPRGTGKCMDTEFGKVFVILNLSSLCLFFTALELLPMLWAILIFLPLWTVYVICRGVRFFKFPEEKSITCTGLMCLLIIGVPSLIEWGLSEILPK